MDRSEREDPGPTDAGLVLELWASVLLMIAAIALLLGVALVGSALS
ncbi:MAG TPA: hypothetical protein VE669_02955 [Actinomycetota bacterium]|jgi:hypothetical protein|nr:hypothetical protein [Actinomycetota bacterium]